MSGVSGVGAASIASGAVVVRVVARLLRGSQASELRGKGLNELRIHKYSESCMGRWMAKHILGWKGAEQAVRAVQLTAETGWLEPKSRDYLRRQYFTQLYRDKPAQSLYRGYDPV